jgi:hypothetical protein
MSCVHALECPVGRGPADHHNHVIDQQVLAAFMSVLGKTTRKAHDEFWMREIGPKRWSAQFRSST